MASAALLLNQHGRKVRIVETRAATPRLFDDPLASVALGAQILGRHVAGGRRASN